MWSSVVLLKYDVVGLSLDERNDIRLNNIIPIAYTGHYLRFRIQEWANILFTDESRFHLDSSDDRSRVYRRVGERYADACVIQRQSFVGGSVMVWGGITAHGRTLADLADGVTVVPFHPKHAQ
jgi:hypothetical protein